MFAWWGRTVYRYRYIVIGVMVALCLGGGVYGLSLGKHVTQSGFYDEGSQSVTASILGDKTYGRDRTAQIVATFTAPDGKTVDDPAWRQQTVDELNKFVKDHPEQVLGWAGYLALAPGAEAPNAQIKGMEAEDKKHTFVTIPLKGDDDDTILTNYKTIAPDLQKLEGGKIELAGLEPVANALTGTIATDQRRMEVLAVPLVAVVLFLVFGGAVAAGLPAIVGGLTIAGALGILRFATIFGPVHFFAQPVVSLVGSGPGHRLRAFHREPIPGRDRRRLRHRGRRAADRHDGRAHDSVLGGIDHRVERQPAGVAAGLRAFADLCDLRRGGTRGAAVDHVPAGLPGHPRSPRRRAGRADRLPGALPAELEVFARLPQLARGPAAEDQDPRRSRGRVLGQAGQLGDEAAAGVRDPDRRRDDLAGHPAGQPVVRRHEREIPAAR